MIVEIILDFEGVLTEVTLVRPLLGVYIPDVAGQMELPVGAIVTARVVTHKRLLPSVQPHVPVYVPH